MSKKLKGPKPDPSIGPFQKFAEWESKRHKVMFLFRFYIIDFERYYVRKSFKTIKMKEKYVLKIIYLELIEEIIFILMIQ